jgi:hypothetical protein
MRTRRSQIGGTMAAGGRPRAREPGNRGRLERWRLPVEGVTADRPECLLSVDEAADRQIIGGPSHRPTAHLDDAADPFGTRTNGEHNVPGCLRVERGRVIY